MFDPRRATLRYRLDRGDKLGMIWLALGSVPMVEAAVRARPDGIIIDMQHGLWDRSTLEHAIGVVPSDIPVMVRVAENTALAIGQALDAGAEGVIVPLVETAKAARKAVDAARFPPHGSRSGGGARPLSDFVDYVAGAERGIVVAVMIETAKGVENAEKIAAVEGLDMVFIGTGDLSLSLGAFPNADPRVEQACARVNNACKASWTLCGIFTGNAEQARTRRDQGYRLTITANDIEVIGRGFRQATASFGAPRVQAEAVASAPAAAQIEAKAS